MTLIDARSRFVGLVLLVVLLCCGAIYIEYSGNFVSFNRDNNTLNNIVFWIDVLLSLVSTILLLRIPDFRLKEKYNSRAFNRVARISWFVAMWLGLMLVWGLFSIFVIELFAFEMSDAVLILGGFALIALYHFYVFPVVGITEIDKIHRDKDWHETKRITLSFFFAVAIAGLIFEFFPLSGVMIFIELFLCLIAVLIYTFERRADYIAIIGGAILLSATLFLVWLVAIEIGERTIAEDRLIEHMVMNGAFLYGSLPLWFGVLGFLYFFRLSSDGERIDGEISTVISLIFIMLGVILLLLNVIPFVTLVVVSVVTVVGGIGYSFKSTIVILSRILFAITFVAGIGLAIFFVFDLFVILLAADIAIAQLLLQVVFNIHYSREFWDTLYPSVIVLTILSVMPYSITFILASNLDKEPSGMRPKRLQTFIKETWFDSKWEARCNVALVLSYLIFLVFLIRLVSALVSETSFWF